MRRKGVIVDFSKRAPLSDAGRRAGWGSGSASAPWIDKVREKSINELRVARAALKMAKTTGDKADIAEGREFVRLAIHEARLIPGARVVVVARPGRSVRFLGQEGQILGRDSGRVFRVRLEDLGLDAIIDSRNLRLRKR